MVAGTVSFTHACQILSLVAYAVCIFFLIKTIRVLK